MADFTEYATTCPHCGHYNELATDLSKDARPPDDDDISLCFQCGGVAIFDSKSKTGLRLPRDPHEQLAIDLISLPARMAFERVKGVLKLMGKKQ